MEAHAGKYRGKNSTFIDGALSISKVCQIRVKLGKRNRKNLREFENSLNGVLKTKSYLLKTNSVGNW